MEKEKRALVDAINSYFGCDALYFDIDSYTLATRIMEAGFTKPEWISVKDRLPEYEEPVMGWDAEMRDMGIVNFIYGKFFDILDMSETNVTHWQYLPKPPKGE